MNALNNIRAIDYTIIFVRDMKAMRKFYENVMRLKVLRELGPQWIEYAIGSQTLALTERGMMWHDALTPAGQLSLQLAFRVSPAQVSECAAELKASGIPLAHDLTDQHWGHRTVFFRDPDGNVLEIYAEI